MKTLLHVAGALALALSAAGCAQTVGTGSAAPTITLAQVEADAIAAAQTLCAVAPTAESITGIILAVAGGPGAIAANGLAQTAASSFCGVVKTASAAPVSQSLGLFAAPMAAGPVTYGALKVHGKIIPVVGTPL